MITLNLIIIFLACLVVLDHLQIQLSDSYTCIYYRAN